MAIRANLGSIAPKLRAGVKVSAIGATGRRAGSRAQLSVMLPRDVVRQVKGRAAERGETLRVAVLRALAADGYDINEADLVDRRAAAARVKAELYRRFKEGG